MTLDELLRSLFPDGHHVANEGGVLTGTGRLQAGGDALVVGVAGWIPLGVDEAIRLSGFLLAALGGGSGSGPILVIVDSDSQRMSKRDELLGLNEFLAHLAKTLIQADLSGRPSLLYGHTAAGAFLATAMATRILVALPTAEPVVMDLPSMSKVTKLLVEVLEEKSEVHPGLRARPQQSGPDRRRARRLGSRRLARRQAHRAHRRVA